MKRLIFLTLCIAMTISAHTLNKVVVEDPDALCLDGTKAAYYVHVGDDPNKFVINFEGGGWCGSYAGGDKTLENCLARSKGNLGSSAAYPETLSIGDGILSDNFQNIFRNWTVIHMKYCDGTGHQGYKKEAVDYQGHKLHFRGHNSTIGKLNDIDAKFHIFNAATHIVVSGESAGGLAAFTWANYIAERAATPKVWAVPDSGIFLDEENYLNKQHRYKQLLQSFMAVANIEVDPPTKECVEAHKDETWKCMFAQYIHPFIKVPLFPVQSLYDSWSLPNILGMTCSSGGSFANCNQGQMLVIEQYHASTVAVLKNITASMENGCWAPACSNHVYSFGTGFYSTGFRVPASSEFSVVDSLDHWMVIKPISHQHLDKVSWPDNKPCSGVKLTAEA